MRVVLLLITAAGESGAGSAATKTSSHCSGSRTYELTEEENIVISEDSIDLLWIHPVECIEVDMRKEWNYRLNPIMTVKPMGEGYRFSFRAQGCDSLNFDRCLGDQDLLAVLIRHWADSDRISGLRWPIKVPSDPVREMRARENLGTGTDFLMHFHPPIFLSGLRSPDERKIVMKDNRLALAPIISKIRENLDLHKDGGQAKRGTNVSDDPAGALGKAVRRAPSGDSEPLGESLIIWIYSKDEEETPIAQRTKTLTDFNSSGLIVLDVDEIEWKGIRIDWDREIVLVPRILSIGSNAVAVSRRDVVLTHGFDGDISSLATALREIGTEIIDYSPGEPAWKRFVKSKASISQVAPDTRQALTDYIAVVRRRRPSDLVRRILHRTINRLAPVRIDLSALEELAREANPEGIATQLIAMGSTWRAQLGSNPIYCLASLQAMLVGKILEMPLEVCGQPFTIVPPVSLDVLFNRLDSFNSEQAHKLFTDLVQSIGLRQPVPGGSGGYSLDSKSKIWEYLSALVRAVFHATDGHSLEVVEELMESFRVGERANLVRWCGPEGFNYATWLEEVSGLLEGIYKQAEEAESRLA